jgi:tetratricopeptide (TPR) repeat protein
MNDSKLKYQLLAVACLTACLTSPTARASGEDLIKLLDSRSCRNCKLQDTDLVHANLRDADLRGAQLQRANLGQAKLDGARLNGADLSFTSLTGASLRGADLRGAQISGTDLRQADLSGALLDPGALSRSHWQQARGINPEQLSFVELHNAGVEAATQGRQNEAEQYFGAAIRREPAAAITWVARGITRGQQGKMDQAANDFTYAASLYEQSGETSQAQQLRTSVKQMGQTNPQAGGNGFGSQVLNGLISTFGALAPLAIKAAGMGMGFGI